MALNIQQLPQYEATPAERVERLKELNNLMFQAVAHTDMAWIGEIANQLSWAIDELERSL